MLPFSGNNQNIKIFRSPPKHFAIGYVHNENLPLGNIALQYVIQNNCRKVRWCFLMISCTFWRSRQNLLNSPKLSCGFNWIAGHCESKLLVRKWVGTQWLSVLSEGLGPAFSTGFVKTLKFCYPFGNMSKYAARILLSKQKNILENEPLSKMQILNRSDEPLQIPGAKGFFTA